MDNKTVNVPNTIMKKEQQDYEEAQKNLRIITAKLRLAQQYGIDTTKLSQQKLDRFLRLFDEMEKVSTDARNKTSEIQREGNVEIQKVNQKASEKYTQIAKDIDNLVKSVKESQHIIGVAEQQAEQQLSQDSQVSPIQMVEKKDETIEEKAARLADLMLGKSKEKLIEEIVEVLKKAQDIGKTADAIADITTNQGIKNSEDVIKKVEIIENIKVEAKKAVGGIVEEEIIQDTPKRYA